MTELKITRRHLPHWYLEGSIYFITFKTYKTVLTEEEIQIIIEHIKDGDKKFYDCYAVVIMPNHVHLLIQPKEGIHLDRIMRGIKGVTSHKINLHRHTKSKIWLSESYDRIIRDGNEFETKLNYMYNNPIKEGLTDSPESYVGWWLNERLFI